MSTITDSTMTVAAEQRSFPKYVLANCHPEPMIFSVVPEGHEHRPTEVLKCVGANDVCYVFSGGNLQPRYDAMQEILRRSNLHDELVAVVEGFLSRHRVPEVTADPDNDPFGPCICGNCCRGRDAITKARGEAVPS